MTLQRCAWATHSPLEQDYHDQEWGVPQHDERALFELLTLEGMQAGLSWSLILKKREAFRAAFDQFDYQRIASYGDRKLTSLLADPAIIRNRLKIRAAVTNAQAFMHVQDDLGSFDHYLWSFVDGQPQIGNWQTEAEVPCSSPLSDLVSTDLRRRGFKFVGTTIVYSYLQATGVLNDHVVSCFKHTEQG
ncbi:DNA-3-methyladenine glycosylase I [Bombiscardovia nodaiensis]|uniref:DNA-3-methyladenine glycosylase I n=1 Tax=Bombiscardovia nodaiensis TaxID=2932181 RepID=A0ABM8B898_9BIFI|nr:DNA-3-methyladenine glycosylase I [Bombiscardovia nodaiensis]